VPGVLFSEFLLDVNKFLTENKQEIAVIRIGDNGIDTHLFSPLKKAQVSDFLEKTIDKKLVGYTMPEDLKQFNQRTLQEVIADGKRVIVLFDNFSVNDSYGNAYTQSLTDPAAVIGALNETLDKPAAGYDYTVLQLQDTGSAALEHYIPEILEHPASWLNDLVFSRSGNILQATKPIFDNSTYQWLTGKSKRAGINRQEGFVVLLNDFVDIALTEHAIALSKGKCSRTS
jgi:hypothetical protein